MPMWAQETTCRRLFPFLMASASGIGGPTRGTKGPPLRFLRLSLLHDWPAVLSSFQQLAHKGEVKCQLLKKEENLNWPSRDLQRNWTHTSKKKKEVCVRPFLGVNLLSREGKSQTGFFMWHRIDHSCWPFLQSMWPTVNPVWQKPVVCALEKTLWAHTLALTSVSSLEGRLPPGL